MISKLFVFLFSISIIGVLIVAAYSGVIYLNIKYVGPYRHSGNTEKAELFNQNVWENGFAEIYTISATVEFDGAIVSDSVEITCVPKIETENISLKGGPYIYDGMRNLTGRQEQELVMRLIAGYRVKIDARQSCQALSRLSMPPNFPTRLSYNRPARIEHNSGTLVACMLRSNERPSQPQNIHIPPLEIVSHRQVPVRDILSRDEYGVADRAVGRGLGDVEEHWIPEAAPRDRQFYWSEENMCWEGSEGCSQIANTICLPEL